MRRTAVLVVALVLGAVCATVSGADETTGAYLVTGVSTREARSAIAGTGAGIDDVGPDSVVVRATPAERDAIAGLGFTLQPLVGPRDFPASDAAYHNYSESVADLDAVAQAHPGTVRRFSIGTSYEGRDLAGVRISDDAQDTGVEPGVLFVGLHHAREHLTVEVVLSLVHLFAESTDPAVQALVASRQIYIVPQLNPDGGEFDIATGSYAYWRKNRQPNAGTFQVGTDPNRNYGYGWGCCNGSSGDPASETYRGPAPFSAPEVDAMRHFVEAHPNLRTAISYHSSGDQIMYPYGYTYTDVPSDLPIVDHDAFVAMANQMATGTGYTPQQLSDLYITDGDWTDWMYGARRIYAFTIELSGYGYGFYPPASYIPQETAKNRDLAVLTASLADCALRAAGLSSCNGTANFDGDADTDVGVFRPSNGVWYAGGGSPKAVQWGVSGDLPAPGDYDRDGKTDVGVYRPSTGIWYLGGATPSAVAWGASGDVPVPGDYDGDGRTEVAVFRPSTGVWYLKGPTPSAVTFGVSGDVPVPGDYNGDGRTDVAVYRPSTHTWYLGGTSPSAAVWGTTGDVPVPADFNGDRKADIAVFRPSTGIWYLGGGGPSAVAWGASGDVPVPGDYNGDGRSEVAVFRPATGVWYTGGPSPTSTIFGEAADVPVALPFAVFDAFF